MRLETQQEERLQSARLQIQCKGSFKVLQERLQSPIAVIISFRETRAIAIITSPWGGRELALQDDEFTIWEFSLEWMKRQLEQADMVSTEGWQECGHQDAGH